MSKLKELLELAESQVGYQEKADSAYLDDPYANAGYNNYTKYSRDVDSWGLEGCQGQPWCATYQFWLEAKIFGVEKALEHFCMKRSSYQAYHCFSIYNAFERKGRISSNPQTGALIVFKHSHIGRVTAVKNGYVYTNEGNTSALYGDSNGGTVKNKKYLLSDPSIKGYCLIDYEAADKGIADYTDAGSLKMEKMKEYQNWLNIWYGKLLSVYLGDLLEEDGIYGTLTRKASLIVWKDIMNRLYGCSLPLSGDTFGENCQKAANKAVLKRRSSGTLVAVAEGLLTAAGDYHGEIDALFGDGAEQAVKTFQSRYGLMVDGEVGRETWTCLYTNGVQ